MSDPNQKSSKNNGKGGNGAGNAGGGNGGGGKNNGAKNQQQGQRKRKKSRKKPRLDPVKYWGDPGALPVRNDYALEGADPTAVVRSLGKAPIPGKNSAPELYFEVLYQRAAGLAQALSFAGGLNQEPADETSSGEPSSGGTSSGGPSREADADA